MIKIDNQKALDDAIEKLQREFRYLNWEFTPDPDRQDGVPVLQWLGRPEEEVMVTVFKGRHINERFHRQDYFFVNFAYHNDYQALSAKYDHQITVHEGDCYVGQPASGYALRSSSDEPVIIIGLLVQRRTFFQEFLASLASDSAMFRFFLQPQTDQYSDEYIHLTFPKESPVWQLLSVMTIEYAKGGEGSQKILKPLMLAITMYISREFRKQRVQTESTALSDRIMDYMGTSSDSMTLKDIAKHFGYHPNYISTLLHRETGQTFSQILLQKRMERAALLMNSTDFSLEEIASMLGYSNHSNFYKAFRQYYHMTPREYQKKMGKSSSSS